MIDNAEMGWFEPGTTGCMIEVDGWRPALGICYDASFPEHGRGLALEGADAHLVSGAFPLGDSDHRRSVYFPARALENTVYVAFANFVGAHDGRQYCGRSAVHGPDGRLFADAGPDQPGMAMAELDPETLRQTRETLQMLGDRRADHAPIRLARTSHHGQARHRAGRHRSARRRPPRVARATRKAFDAAPVHGEKAGLSIAQ